MEQNKNRRFLTGLLTGVLVTLLVCALVVGGVWLLYRHEAQELAGVQQQTQSENGSDAIDYDIVKRKLKVLQKKIDGTFLFETDTKTQEEGIYKGYMESLGDPYSVYYTAEEYKDLMESTTGEYKGIGVQVTYDTDSGLVYVVKVFKESGAMEAGVKPGDRVTKVDGEDVKGQDITTVVSKMRGEADTMVQLEVYRESTQEYLTMDVARSNVQMDTVEWRMLEDGIGYLYISEFEDVTADQFRKGIEDLKRQGMKALVLDVRDDPGGLVNACVQIANDLLPGGTIVSTEDKNGNSGAQSAGPDTIYDGPMVALANENSASASEILLGALQDNGRAEVIGVTTFGKGIIQNIIPLGDGTAIKLTSARYFSLNGTAIHGEGIHPDVEIKLDTEREYAEDEYDNQLEKAVEVLKGKM